MSGRLCINNNVDTGNNRTWLNHVGQTLRRTKRNAQISFVRLTDGQSNHLKNYIEFCLR